MELKWMEKHRSLVEKIIKYGNAYAFCYNKQKSYGTNETFSASQIQTLEYILEAEDSDQTMSQMAVRLGVSKSTFSKNVKSLVEKGLLEKFYCNDNRKNIYVKPTQKGRETYNQYTQYVYELAFKDMFDIADEIPADSIEKFEQMLDLFSERLIWFTKKLDDDGQENKKVFTKIE
ncbi:MAG: MarR family transcriptional regulator [Acutalibacteraceae bacterium]|nr:MarR family transcriptional regulator [Clostridiales bacterium]